MPGVLFFSVCSACSNSSSALASARAAAAVPGSSARLRFFIQPISFAHRVGFSQLVSEWPSERPLRPRTTGWIRVSRSRPAPHARCSCSCSP